jgi:hypothetical protein
MLLSPCHGRGRCLVYIRRLLPKPFAKSSIADYERLIPLIEHLGYAGELDLPPQLAQKSGYEFPLCIARVGRS